MSGTSRIKSAADIYHVMVRGNNKQKIFLDNDDYTGFIDLLYDKVKQKRIALYAWCLMPNHVHLLVKEKQEPTGTILLSVLTAYVKRYNRKYKRTGHLFEGRFRSRPVEDETYFLRVFRYIHRNPLEAGLCSRMEDYPYSSFAHYFRNEKYGDDDLILNLWTKKEFEAYHHEKDGADDFLYADDPGKISDAELADLAVHSGIVREISEVKNGSRDARTRVIRMMLLAGGSYRQISRVTGIGINVIRAVRQQEAHED